LGKDEMTNGEKKAARTAVEKLLKEINGALVKREKGAARAVKHVLARAKKMMALHSISEGVETAIGLDSEREAFEDARSVVETLGERALQRIDGGAS
jgi:UDP-N-acetylmuramyl tripeptide synthase